MKDSMTLVTAASDALASEDGGGISQMTKLLWGLVILLALVCAYLFMRQRVILSELAKSKKRELQYVRVSECSDMIAESLGEYNKLQSQAKHTSLVLDSPPLQHDTSALSDDEEDEEDGNIHESDFSDEEDEEDEDIPIMNHSPKASIHEEVKELSTSDFTDEVDAIEAANSASEE